MIGPKKNKRKRKNNRRESDKHTSAIHQNTATKHTWRKKDVPGSARPIPPVSNPRDCQETYQQTQYKRRRKE